MKVLGRMQIYRWEMEDEKGKMKNEESNELSSVLYLID